MPDARHPVGLRHGDDAALARSTPFRRMGEDGRSVRAPRSPRARCACSRRCPQSRPADPGRRSANPYNPGSPGDWCNGNMGVSKTLARGSIPRSPAPLRTSVGFGAIMQHLPIARTSADRNYHPPMWRRGSTALLRSLAAHPTQACRHRQARRLCHAMQARQSTLLTPVDVARPSLLEMRSRSRLTPPAAYSSFRLGQLLSVGRWR